MVISECVIEFVIVFYSIKRETVSMQNIFAKQKRFYFQLNCDVGFADHTSYEHNMNKNSFQSRTNRPLANGCAATSNIDVYLVGR